MSDEVKTHRPATWYTTILLAAGLALLTAGCIAARHILATIDSGAAYIFIAMAPAPMILTGFYTIVSALRQKVVVKQDEIIIVDGLRGKKVVKQVDVEGFVLRDQGSVLELKISQKEGKTTFHTAVEMSKDLKGALNPTKEISEFEANRAFNLNSYPKTFSHSMRTRLEAWFWMAVWIGLWVWFGCRLVEVHFQSTAHVILGLGLFLLMLPVVVIKFIRWQRALFNREITLHEKSIDISGLMGKKIISRSDITYFCYLLASKKRPARVQISTVIDANYASKAYVLYTYRDFEKDRAFIDWFNTLDVPSDARIPSLRQSY